MPAAKIFNFQFSIFKQERGFTLVELMVSITIIAILTLAAIPSFSGFTKSQALTQNFKSLKSDLRIAQSRSISGSTSAGNSKAWGIHFREDAAQYEIFSCTPAQNVSYYVEYVYSNARCGSSTPFKVVLLGPAVKIHGLSPIAANVLDLVFDSQNGSVYANGVQVGATIGITYSDNSGLQTVSVTSGGGISD